MKTVIIGGVAGGATAAARLRRLDEKMEILMFDRGHYISYANCGLPYHIGNVIEDRDALLLQTPEGMKAKYNVDVRIRTEITSILPDSKEVEAKNLDTGEVYRETYDNLIISTGSSPIMPPIDGIDSEKVFTLWTVPQMDSIISHIKENDAKRAVVVGGGFIGLEVAENLHELGLDVSLVEMQNQVMAPVDPEMAQLLHENMAMNNVKLHLGRGVTRIEQQGTVEAKVVLDNGDTIATDIVIMSAGVKPNSEFAKSAGIETNKRGGIIVDERFRTNKPEIYAIGDVIEVENFVSKDRAMIPLAGPANRQGRMLADIICGADKKYKGTIGTSVAKVFDLTVASTGINEKKLKADGLKKDKDYFVAIINQKSHAGYYPGATNITLKLLFAPDGKILGAQAVGQEGVDKRIDTISVAIGMNGTVSDLTEMEAAYAPPYSSAKDPVNMLGFVAENILEGLVKFTDPSELDEMIAEGRAVTILDVTEEIEHMVFAIPGSVNIPLGKLRDRLEEIDRSKPVVVYCAVGVRSYNGARILTEAGFKDVSVLSGGTAFYKSMHFEAKAPTPCESPNDDVSPEEGESKEIRVLNCCGLQCPGPIMKVNEALGDMEDNQMLKVSATDMGFAADIGAWCDRTGNTLVKTERQGVENIVYVRKGTSSVPADCDTSAPAKADNQRKTIVVFSGDLDKVLASFIIANGAAAMGRPVTMFFTFWGLNALRKSKAPKQDKSMMEKMFSSMMPKGTGKLKLSKMNMGGMGTAMMKKVMNDKNVDSLEDLMKSAMNNGVKLVACTMSMDVMGIRKEELIDGVELAGVASYLGDAEVSNVNLFV